MQMTQGDRLIDALASLCVACIFYRLYGLTEEEIAIGEGKNGAIVEEKNGAIVEGISSAIVEGISSAIVEGGDK